MWYSITDKRQQKSADGDLEEQIKAKLLSQFTQGDHGFTTNNQRSRQPAPILPDNSKDIGNFFESKPESSHKEVDMTNYFKQQQQQQQQQPSLPPLPVDKSPSPNEDHMIHVGISHVKNESSVNNVARVSEVSVKVSCICISCVCTYVSKPKHPRYKRSGQELKRPC